MERKYCKGCRQYVDREGFHQQRHAKDGLQRQCKDCMREISREAHYSGLVVSRGDLPAQKCVRCGHVQPIGEFKYNYRTNRRNRMCDGCHSLERPQLGPRAEPLSAEVLERRIDAARDLKERLHGLAIPDEMLDRLLPT